MLEFVVSPPRFFSGKKVDKILDPDAIKSSLKYGDAPLLENSLVSGEYNIEVA